ncbi:protein POLYCHOME-like [Aristolochia californica]|uniref:protein POLYCHOME-like n=1 Tax=Aristolochia californica TaxID=171875 RepID=UPI0035DF8B89
MPDATDRLPGRGPGGSVLGFGNGTGFYLTERPRNGNQVRFDGSASVNNENAAPQRSRSRLRGPSSGSPLPRWYPRTPLRDITAIVNAIELRRERERAIAEIRRRNRLLSPRTPLLLSSPSSQEPSSFDQFPSPTHGSLSIVSDYSSHFTTEPQKEVSTPVSTSASGKLVGKKLSDWEELERILMENLEKKMKGMEVKKKPEKSRLMSMR